MFELILSSLSSSIVIILASLSGVIFSFKLLSTWLTERLRYLVALAGGVFTAIILSLFEEAFHEGISPFIVLGTLVGILFLETVTRFLPKGSHHLHAPCKEHEHTRLDARRMMLVDSIHNIHDGLALVPAFLISPVIGWGTAIGIFFHELVQEISEFFILKEAGYSTKRALIFNFSISLTLLIGVGISLFLSSLEGVALPLIAFSGGGFLYILVRDLIPEIFATAKREGRFIPYIISFGIGFLIMFSLGFILPEKHYEETYPLPDGFELV